MHRERELDSMLLRLFGKAQHIYIYLSEALDESSTVSNARRKLLKRSASSSHLHARRADSIYIYEYDGRNRWVLFSAPISSQGLISHDCLSFPFPTLTTPYVSKIKNALLRIWRPEYKLYQVDALSITETKTIPIGAYCKCK